MSKDDATGLCAVIDPGCHNDSIDHFIGGENKLIYIILTHAHWDHIVALNEYKSNYPNAKLIVNFDEHEMITDSSINGTKQYANEDIALEADIYVADNEELMLGNTTLKFITTPGHTKGGMCILAEGNLFSGDTLFFQECWKNRFIWRKLGGISRNQFRISSLKLDGKTTCISRSWTIHNY